MPDSEQIREWTTFVNTISNGYKKSQLLFTAVKAGIFDLLETPQDSEAVAASLGWSERGVSLMLNGLVACGLLKKDESRYSNAPIAFATLAKKGQAYQGDIIKHNLGSWEHWSTLDERVRTGRGLASSEKRSGESLRNFILGMANTAQLSAQAVLSTMDLSPYGHMLDLGGGPGAYSIAFTQAYPNLRATLFDRADVVEIAKEQCAAAQCLHRIDFITGDCLNDDLGTGYDFVFISNLIHSFSEADNAALLRKVYHALEPGGMLLIKDFIVENDRSGPPFSLMFALHMLVHTEGGNTYSYDEIQAWTDEAGFEGGESIALTPQTRLWIVHKT
ncbi:MAG: methyltransferase domain-containing protein [Candidatus Hydrogenedentes bacterium]|nr:methyltransferase domain-containing protein [Candidatus Hydrogenedentota bacterium]